MLTKYSNYISKFSSPMACYVYEAWLMEGDNGDDETESASGYWAVRYGKRILLGDAWGSVALDKYEDVDQARAIMVALKGHWEVAEEEDAP